MPYPTNMTDSQWSAILVILKDKRKLVYYYFNKWKLDGTIEAVHEALRVKTRKDAGRESSPGSCCSCS